MMIQDGWCCCKYQYWMMGQVVTLLFSMLRMLHCQATSSYNVSLRRPAAAVSNEQVTSPRAVTSSTA
jgi:hypothetical protein